MQNIANRSLTGHGIEPADLRSDRTGRLRSSARVFYQLPTVCGRPDSVSAQNHNFDAQPGLHRQMIPPVPPVWYR